MSVDIFSEKDFKDYLPITAKLAAKFANKRFNEWLETNPKIYSSKDCNGILHGWTLTPYDGHTHCAWLIGVEAVVKKGISQRTVSS
jgi:hypothetical protein